MIVFLGAILTLAALIVRIGHEVVRRASRIQLRHLVELEVPGASALQLHLEDASYFRAAMSSWETAFLLAGSMLICGGSFPSGSLALLLTTGILGGLAYAVLGVLAASFAHAAGERLTTLVAAAVAPLAGLSRLMVSARADGEATAPARSAPDEEEERESFEELLEEGVREGIGDSEDMKLVSGVVEMRDLRVRDVMVPRHDIFALPADLSTHEIATRIAASGYSRVPIFSGSLDTIVGMYHVLDILKAGTRAMPPLRPVASASQLDRCGDLLHRMLRQQAHICIVTDPAGHTSGLVTLEDLLEEIVGEIRDEYDEPAPGLVSQWH